MGRRVRRNLVGKARALFGTSAVDHKSNLLGVWPKWGPWLIVNATSFNASPPTATPPWTWTRATVTDGHADWLGGVNAFALVEDGSLASSHAIDVSQPAAIGPLTYWVPMKMGTRRYIMARSGPGYSVGVVDLQAGTYNAAPMTALGGGWWLMRRSVSGGTMTGSPHSFQLWGSAGPLWADTIYDGVLGDEACYFMQPWIEQTSIVTVPNLHASIALRDFLNRLDLTNPAKASEPIDRKTDWNGRECAGFYGANQVSAAAIGALLSGEDVPHLLTVAVDLDSSPGTTDVATLGSAASGVFYFYTNAAAALSALHRDNTAALLATPTAPAAGLSRMSVLWENDGVAWAAAKNGSELAVTTPAHDLGDTTLTAYTEGAGLIGGTMSRFMTGTQRLSMMARIAPGSARVRARATTLLRAYAGGIA